MDAVAPRCIYHGTGAWRQVQLPFSSAMGRAVTYAIEAAVGIGCLIGVPPAWRGRRHALAGILLLAGLAAVLHAVLSLAS
jgi:hypothetical protein